jgi:hypothetical protein
MGETEKPGIYWSSFLGTFEPIAKNRPSKTPRPIMIPANRKKSFHVIGLSNKNMARG